MAVNTGKVTGRRAVAYESLDDVLVDAERLVAAPKVKMLGNWSLGQMLAHLAGGMHMSIDGTEHRAQSRNASNSSRRVSVSRKPSSISSRV